MSQRRVSLSGMNRVCREGGGDNVDFSNGIRKFPIGNNYEELFFTDRCGVGRCSVWRNRDGFFGLNVIQRVAADHRTGYADQS